MNITLVKADDATLTDAERNTLRRFLFGSIDGLRSADKRAWRKFWKKLTAAQTGELFNIGFRFDRSGGYHRRHMKFEATVFEAQEQFEHFEQFRHWLKIGAGWCDWVPGPKGAVVPIPKSIAYEKMEQPAMEEFHANVLAFVRSAHAQKVLWRHLDETARADMAETLIEGFEDDGHF